MIFKCRAGPDEPSEPKNEGLCGKLELKSFYRV